LRCPLRQELLSPRVILGPNPQLAGKHWVQWTRMAVSACQQIRRIWGFLRAGMGDALGPALVTGDTEIPLAEARSYSR
jgi:hypothetical protein